MSINVTVHGNPVSIKRGKMVAIDADKEFERRRKIRLQQVRQQSKEIAEEVRNKVRKEKNKQLNHLDKKADNDLKKLQERKLSTLRKQYQDCLNEFGYAHKLAQNQPEADEILQKLSRIDRETAEIRGQDAIEKQMKENLEKQRELNKHIENKQYARDVENIRAKAVSNLQKSKEFRSPFKVKRKKRIIANVKINGISEVFSDSDNGDESVDKLMDLSIFDDTTSPSNSKSLLTNVTLDSTGNSYSCSGSPENERLKENDVIKMKTKVCTPTEDVFTQRKICFNSPDKEAIKNKLFEFKNDNSDQNSYTSHKELYQKYLKAQLQAKQNASIDHNEMKSKPSVTSSPVKMKHSAKAENEIISCDPNKSLKYSERFSHNDDIDRDLIQKYRDRLQSGTDENIDMYLGRICDEDTCPRLNAGTTSRKIEKRPLKTSKPISKHRKESHTKKSPRRVIVSSKSPKNLNGNEPPYTESEQNNVDSEVEGMFPLQSCSIGKRPSISKLKYVAPVKLSPSKNTESCLPFVPKTTVREENPSFRESSVHFYDRYNRFNKDGQQQTIVQKIDKDSIEVCPCSDDDRQQRDMMMIRDEEARIRGIRAYEKIKIQRDYQQLMEELPILQRQERLTSIGMRNATLHMSEERYKEYERKKQNRLENEYENFDSALKNHDRPIITIKPTRKSPPGIHMKQPFHKLDVSNGDTPVLNVGKWETIESSVDSTSPEITTESSLDKEKALTDLLKRVNRQRQILLKEAANLPALQNLKRELDDRELINLLCNSPPKQTEVRTKLLVETGTSPLLTRDTNVPKKTKKTKSTKSVSSKSSVKRTATSSSDTSVETPHQKTVKKGKKPHKKQKVLIREEGTQTSPIVTKNMHSICKIEKNKREEATQTSPYCPNLINGICFCPKESCPQGTDVKDHPKQSYEKSNNSSDLVCERVCEIIITAAQNSNIHLEKGFGDQRQYNPVETKRDSLKKSNLRIKIKEPTDKNDILTRNGLDFSTSTSYMSPPIDKTKFVESVKPSCTSWKDASQRSSNKVLLQPQKQQTNLDSLVTVKDGSKEVNSRLVKYITKLLNMSRQSVDDLTISSVSDISTPTDSVMQTANNIAKDKLLSVLDHFQLSVDDIKKYYLSTTSCTSEASAENVLHSGQDTAHSATAYDETDKDVEDGRRLIPGKQFVSVSTSTDLDDNVVHLFPSSLKSTVATSVDNDISEARQQDQSTSRVSVKSQTQILSKDINKPSSTIGDASTITDREQSAVSQSHSDKQDSSNSTKVDKATFVRQIRTKSSHEGTSSGNKTEIEKRETPYYTSSTEYKRICSPRTKTPERKLETAKQKSKSKTITPLKDTRFAPIYSTIENVDIPITSDTLQNENAVWRQPEKFLQFVRQSLGMTVTEFSELGFHEMFSKHMQLTEYCHDRIRSLMALIEKVRNDKRNILTPSPIDQSTTSYLDLPPPKVDSAENINEKSPPLCLRNHNGEKLPEIETKSESTSSISQSTLDEYLLGVDEEDEPKKPEKSKKRTSETQVDRDQNTGIEKIDNSQDTFVPMLQGIPKYSDISPASSTSNFLSQLYQHIKPKPPPSLTRSNMRGHTDATPHELSTIVEAETIVSSRNTSVHPPQSPERKTSSRTASPKSQQFVEAFLNDDPEVPTDIHRKTVEMTTVSPTKSNKSEPFSDSGGYVTISPDKTLTSDRELKRRMKMPKESCLGNADTSSSSIQDPRAKSIVSGIQPLSDSTTESPDELESMLRKFKLDWAIALVKKTEQALALSSSSSTSELSNSKLKQETSDMSLKDAYKHICQRLASSSGSDVEKSLLCDLSHHFKEFHDISEIPGPSESRNKSQQRTSTPVHHSKSTDSKKTESKESLFRGDSELSSVRNTSEENMFLSIPNVTLNTTKCALNKSKK